MLLSPGHSPRHLSTPSESTPRTDQNSIPNPNPNNPNYKTSLATTSRKNSTAVLDEDTYVAAIEKIIERDFFPDIPKLRDRLDWLEAVRTGDPLQIRDAQLKILERRRHPTTHGNQTTQTQTPSSAFSRNPSSSITPFVDPLIKTPLTNNYDTPSSTTANVTNYGQPKDAVDVGVDLSLDQFFRRYTSEDNESFSKIIEKVNRKRKERYGYLLEGENDDEDGESKRERVITDGFGTSDQPVATLQGWKYTAKNLLMYHPSDRGEVSLTEEERAQRLNALTKEISKTNTRFHGKMVDSKPKEDDNTMAVLYTPVPGATPIPFSDRNADKVKKYDLEDLKKTPDRFYAESGKKAENGYSFVRTPSPAPDSPFITWGEIEGTPVRLDLEDTPIDIGGSGNGPQFKIPLPPSRDIKAHSLSRDAARKIRERSKMFQKPPLPSPSVRGGSASPRTLSPAAQKFVRNAIAKSSNSHSLDESLRASYRGASPGMTTPKSGRSTSRLARDGSISSSRSPSVKEGSNPPW